MKHLLLVYVTAALLAQSWGTQRQDEDLVRDRRDVEEIEEEEAPNGWGPWATVGKCSRSCGGGIHYEERSCYQISNSSSNSSDLVTASTIKEIAGGDEDLCLGPSKRYASCNVQDCPADSTDFRHVQCANFNTHDFNGKVYEWVPYYEVDDESVCELNCQAVGETFYNRLAKWVVDGTSCRPDSTDICITGVCKPVGCDGVLGSNQEYDECRVCGGDGSSCHFKKGTVATDKLILGYNDILLIPAGATNIHIQEKEASNNYIAVRNLDGEFYFNKEWLIDPSGMYDIAGTKFIYHRGNEPALDPEYLSANGPTTEAVYVTVLSQSLADKPEILYELYMPNVEELKEEGKEVYSWEAGTWGKCSRHCNTGDRQRAIRCLNSEGGEVDLDLCDESTKPEEDENCNTQKCEASWYVEFWEDCLAECGEGEQERTVFCQQEHEPDVYVMVEDVLCKDNPRPRSNRPCDTGIPCPEPQVSADVVSDASPEASQVSENVQVEESPSETEWESEEVETSDAMSEATPLESVSEPEASPEDNDAEAEMSPDDVPDVALESESVSSSEDSDADSEIGLTSEWDVSDLLPVTMTQPEKMVASVEALEIATNTETAMWELGPWSACNQVCGSGTQIRHVYCARMGTCDPSMKPTETQECNLMPCEGVEWVRSDWQGCSENCEGGTETRTVVCSTQEGTVYPDNTCDLGRQPIIERPCPSTCVPKPKWHTSEWSQCSVRCGSGVQKRRVVCAIDNGDTLTVAMESECDAKAKMPQEQPCTGTDCTTATWFSAPFGKCSAECGGGQKKREVLCFSDSSHVDSSHCDANQRPALYEDCNNQPCDEDNLLIVGGCKGTRHGCCPDGLVAAEGPNYLGCPARDPIPRGACIEMDFGCCLDGITPAQGPFLYGCPKYTCKDTEYGCCIDGQTAAKGSGGEGCPDRIYGCDRYGYGCCPDRMTSATGPNHAGCPSETPVAILVGCAQTAFGCCADGVAAAAGVNHLGCPESRKDKAVETEGSGEPCETGDCNVIQTSCSSSLHGCCQDGRTPASGPDYLGCPSPKTITLACVSTAYGCCPDGTTPALGANNEGCDDGGSGEIEGDCQTRAYGCCPDGSTAAQGPSYEGCDVDCDVMVYGCCPDGVHAAKGSNFLGCAEERAYVKTCADDKYGCCPDGKTPALGPYNAGCPSVIAKRAECGLPNERGPCSNYTVRWAFDVSYGECSRFWYGGCEGNGNNFLTKDECRQGCVHPDSEIEMCYLPKSVGRCRASVMRYYYNAQTRQCEEFSYGGCLGNDNRFETREVCETRCVAPHTPDVCNQPSLVGPCRGHFQRWFYDHADSTCKQFVYGGCQGNDNRFNSKDDCEQRCLSPATTVCRLNKDVGPCNAYFKSWYFDASTGQCAEFGYGGCGGNNNRFTTKDECKKTCRELLAEKQIDICSLRKETGPCTAYFERWYYDKSDGYCKIFVYGGCQGNKNRFIVEEECRSQCRAKPPVDMCTLPKAVGSCDSAIQRYFFNAASATCEEFLYSGCGGNGNSFDTLEECEKSCDKHVRKFVVPKGKERCYQPVVPGPCLNSLARYHYNSVSGECEEFQYGGCGGNHNRFLTIQQCEDECKKTTTAVTAAPTTPEKCTLHYNPGPCKDFSILWYFDILEGRCKDFLYGGCKGNENQFLSREECEQECTSEPDATCTLNYDSGGCFAYIPMFYFDTEKAACIQFIYGGCGGNTNRFKTRLACEQRCQSKKQHSVASGLSICVLPKETGVCDGLAQLSVTKWYYNMEAGQCEKFIYSLCGGNENRFKSKTECEEACPVADVCHLESMTGPCRASKRRYHFDAATGKCDEFTYGGCNGNANRFLKLESCEAACQQFATITTAVPAITTDLEMCSKPREAGKCHTYSLRWYHDKMQEKCSQFVFSGCGGNDNNFQTEEECERRCQGAQVGNAVIMTTAAATTAPDDEDVCALSKETGPCKGFFDSWYYDSAAGKCLQFVYGGCDGNGNRFETKEACQRKCSQPAAIVEESEEKTDSSGDDDDFDICQLKQDMGTCYNYQIKWFYDASISRCRRFYYGSCGGNGNRFETREECVQMCVERKVKPKLGVEEQVCELNPEVGSCNDTIERWFYNASSDHCEEFVYGGCHGNGNNFELESECAATCGRKNVTEINDDCMAPVDIGPCKAAIVRWYFDADDHNCKDFIFGGCDGNTNNFATKEKCERTCTKFVAEDKRMCDFTMDVGQCDESIPRWHFDKSLGKCIEFQYTGCDGNANNFVSRDECESLCVEEETEQSQYQKNKKMGTCRLPKVVGPCFDEVLRFYFDEVTGLCRPFLYGGCQGNKNNFKTQEECYAICTRYPDKYETTKPGDCFETSDAGSCDLTEARWFFDANKGDCVAFYYGGCDGNGNNFKSYDDCNAFCSKVSHTCGVLTCDLSCPHGFARGVDGCQECKCLDPCEKVDCPDDQMCVIEKVACRAQPCPAPKAVCKAKPKTFKCPVFDRDTAAANCFTECDSDDECDNTSKCCSTGCGRICVDPSEAAGLPACPTLAPTQAHLKESTCSSDTDCADNDMCCFNGNTNICVARPQVAGCVHTLFGCCPDGSTEAKGWNFIGCPAEAPVILTEKTQFTVAEGGIIVIPCKSRAAPKAQVTWYKDRKPLRLSEKLNGFRRLTDGSLEISHVTQSEHGIYTCRAFNSIGAATKTFTLLVQVAPVFEDTPREVVTTAGEKAVLECAASGSPKPQIRWLRNHQLISIDTVHIMQWQNGTLVIDDVQEADAGNYTCEANNGMEAPPRRVVSLSVLGRMYVSLDKSEVTTDRGEELKLVCRTRSEPDISLEWSKDGDTIDEDDSHIEVMENELFIKELRVADSGEYTCTASRGLESVSATAIVKVKGIDLPDNCTDKPWYANCALIIEGGYCTHPYFKVFCCKSCYEAGKLS